MQKVVGKTIVLTRGDSFKQIITAKDMDGKPYTPVSGDVIRFAVKKNYSDQNIVIEKQIPYDTMLLQLSPSDTKSLEFGTYVYDIKITYANGDVNTFLDKGTLKLTEEVDGTLPPIPASGEYEAGEWTPEEDTARGTIPFANQHSNAPFYYLVARKSTETNTTPSAFIHCQAVNWKAILGHGEKSSQDAMNYGLVDVGYANSILPDRVNNNQVFITNDPDVDVETPTSQDWAYYATNTELKPGIIISNYTWKSSETYEWFAVWMPET